MKTVGTRANGRTASLDLPHGKWQGREAAWNGTTFKAGFGLAHKKRTGCLGSTEVALTAGEKAKFIH